MEPKPEQTKETNICSMEAALDYATLGVLHSKETEGLSALRCSEVEGDAPPLGVHLESMRIPNGGNIILNRYTGSVKEVYPP